MIPIAKPLFDDRELQAVRSVLDSGWVAQGPEVRRFEQELAAAVGAERACAVSSCTAGLELALRAVGVGPDDEVVTVSHSFVATANSVRHVGAVPVFVDVEPETFNIDPSLIEAAITRRTAAILCAHQMGMPCDMERIVELARRRRIPVVEDAACALGSELRWEGEWQRVGRPHGDVACFSFHPRKVITTGDGGMLTSRTEEVDSFFRRGRHHGLDEAGTEASYQLVGRNCRMTDVQAAIGRVQLARLDEIVARRRELAAGYRLALAQIPGISLPAEPERARSNWQSYCIRLPDGVDQRRALQAMLDAGVSARPGIHCAHREPAYARPGGAPWRCSVEPGGCNCPSGSCERLRASEEAQDRCVTLPIYPQLTEEQQRQVVEALRRALD